MYKTKPDKQRLIKIETEYKDYIYKNLERIKHLNYSKEEIENLRKIFIKDFLRKNKITIDKIEKVI